MTGELSVWIVIPQLDLQLSSDYFAVFLFLPAVFNYLITGRKIEKCLLRSEGTMSFANSCEAKD